MIVMIIEAHFAPRDHARMAAEFVEPREMLIGCDVRVVRMDADRRVNPVVLLGKWNRGVKALRGTRAAADREQRLDARRARAFEHRVAVVIEWRAFEVRV